MANVVKMVSPREVLPTACRVLPILLAAGGTVEYVAAAPPHLGRALLFLYSTTAVLLLNQRYTLLSPLTALLILAVFAMVDPHAATDPNIPLFLAMFSMFALAAFNRAAIAIGTGLVGLACLTVMIARVPEPDVVSLIVVVLLLLIAWGAGRLSALRDRISRQMRAQAERASSEKADASQVAVELERARIARELHDIVAHHISVIVVQARGGRRCLESSPNDARQSFDAIEALGREALTEMRQLLGVIRDDAQQAPLSPPSSLRQLQPLLDQLRSSGQAVNLVVEGTPVNLPPGLDLAAYRVVQEGLTNVLKHADHAQANVAIHYRDRDIHLEIADTGGRALTNTAGGDAHHGLLGMRERVALYGGTFSADSQAGGGFVVSVTLPLPQVPA
jgi:signal transduction histidine kinase